MKLVIYFLNFAFSKSLNDGPGTESETRDMANVHDENFKVHEKMQDDMLSNIEHMMGKRSLSLHLNKRFEPTGWLSSMMAGAISKFRHRPKNPDMILVFQNHIEKWLMIITLNLWKFWMTRKDFQITDL